MKKVALGCLIAIIVVIGLFAMGVINTAAWFGSRATKVVKSEVDPVNIQIKYEWFKDQAAALNKLSADIKVYYTNIEDMKADYKDKPRPDWTRDDRNQYAQWRAECSGVVAKYNELAADYNSQMAKWNWRFCNKGELPEGSTEPLPREFAAYKTTIN